MPDGPNARPPSNSGGRPNRKLRSRITTDGLDRVAHRAFMRAMGLDSAAIARPMVGVATTEGEMTPCNMGLARRFALRIAALTCAAAVACSPAVQASGLKIGLLMDYSGRSHEVSRDRQRGFELALKHVNAGGGVLGRPVSSAIGDATPDPQKAVEEARRLIAVEGVHALVGPNSSAAALPVAERVTGPAGIPTVSFSATSPRLSTAADRDFLFRTALSDVAQGPVLARVARERGFDNVGLIHVDDAWGRGLAETFTAAWDGAVRAVAIRRGQTGFAGALRESASGGAQALVVVAFEAEADAIVRQAVDLEIYRAFLFGDAARRIGLVRSLGGARLGGMYGVGGGAGGRSPHAWDAAYIAEYGALPASTFVREAYDAAVALALAAQAAGSVRGAAIRDRLRAVGAAPGVAVTAGPAGVARALRILAAGGEVDYQGAGSTLDWDENGDLRRGRVSIWRFTRDRRIEEVGTILYER